MVATTFLLCLATVPYADPIGCESCALRARAVLILHCGKCHGSDAISPKAGLGYIEDLARLSSNSAMVIPGHPESSLLWQKIADGEMPPPKQEPLTPIERGTIYEWIAGGAPVPSTTSDAAQLVTPVKPSVSLAIHVLSWLGKAHVVLVHFPIALLLAAGLGELLALKWGKKEPWPVVRYCLILGAAGAVIAAVCGWLDADAGGAGKGTPGLLLAHRIVGVLVAFAAVFVSMWEASESPTPKLDQPAPESKEDDWEARTWPVRGAIWSLALLVGIAGHLGGLLVHGTNYFSW